MVAKSREVAEPQGNEISRLTELPLADVQNLHTLEDIERYFAAQGVELSAGEEISDGFEKLENKDRLIGTPIILIDWRELWSDENAGYFHTIRLMTAAGEKYRISDGSTGISAQLREITEVRTNDPRKLPNAGLIVKDGLTKSEYWVSKDGGRALTSQEAESLPADQKRKAATYYLSL